MQPLGTDRAVDELGDAVAALVRAWRGLGRGADLGVLEFAILLGDGEHRLSHIAELRGVDQSVVSRQIGELQARGLVCRRPDPTDRRASLVRLTPEGHGVLDRARRMRRDWLRAALVRTPTADVRTAAELVACLATELESRTAADLGLATVPT